jgi:general stress protein 26
MTEHAWITSLRADGSPRSVRVWFVSDGVERWIATSTSTRKVADIQRDPRVSFVVEGRDDALYGDASLVGITERDDILRAFADKYNGWNAAETGQWGERVYIRVVPR